VTLATAARPRPRVVIVGGGFGGLEAARALRHEAVGVVLVDRNNHHTFQPLLYQVATATLAPSDITAPIRWILRRQRNALVVLGDVCRVDLGRRRLTVDEDIPHGRRELEYDYLVLAMGTRHSYFAHPEWEEHAPGLKSIDDGLEIRRRFLLAFERAELTDDVDERRAYLTFVIVGGGPTGVELAGLIPDVARGFRRDFRRIDTTSSRVVLVERGPRLLPAFPESLAARTLRDLKQLGVEVRLGAVVTRVEEDGAWIGPERVAARTVLWAAGNQASPLGGTLGLPPASLDAAGRVRVEADLSLPGHPEVFVVGDMALATQSNGTPVPGVAQGAIQGGRTAARNIRRTLRGQRRRAFRYLDKGNLATIGRHRAIADFGWLRVAGPAAWWFWLFLHIMYLVGFRNRLSVLVQWAYSYFTYQRGVRLITHMELRRTPVARPGAGS
jgi:NADH dehydrogenase